MLSRIVEFTDSSFLSLIGSNTFVFFDKATAFHNFNGSFVICKNKCCKIRGVIYEQ